MTPLARWTPTLASTRALAVRQPWAWLIVNGRKDVENRSRRTKIRGTILVHASAATSEFARLRADVRERLRCRVPPDIEYGGIVGAVDIVDCLATSASRWHETGYFGWVLRNPRRLPFRPCKGSLGFFIPTFEG